LHEGVVTLVLIQFKKYYKPKIYKNFVSTIMPLPKSATTTHFLVIVVIVTFQCIRHVAIS
jgi:hypothetical protein